MSLRKISIALLALVLLFISSGVLLAFMLTSEQPIVLEPNEVTPQSLAESKKLLHRINQQLKYPGHANKIMIPYDNLDAIFAIASDLIVDLSARHNDLDDLLLIEASLRLPGNPFGQYININTYLSQDKLGGSDSMTTIGDITFNNATLVKLLSRLFVLVLKSDVLPENGDFVENIFIQNRSIHIHLKPHLNTRKLLSSIKSAGKDAADSYLADNGIEHVQYYYDHLVSSTRLRAQSNTPVSLFDYLKVVMKKARQRSNESNVIQQNTSATLALALFVGDRNLKKQLNTLLNIELAPDKKLNTVLRGREDLMLHFIYSSVLQILTNSGVTFSIGEIKEISDSRKGGSGFSFIDIAADRTGSKLAEIATRDSAGALLLLRRISEAKDEKDIFPDISALEEGISDDQFKLRYGNRQSNQYKATLDKIDRRINSLFIFAG